MKPQMRRGATLVMAFILLGCSEGNEPGRTGPTGSGAAEGAGTGASRAEDVVPAGRWFSDVAEALGLAAPHVNGASAKKYMPETVGSGAALADFDGDGRLDLYVVNQCSLADPAATAGATNRLYLQRSDGGFEDVTAASGAAADPGFGMGCATADYDGDGDQDIYLCNLGENRLLRNDGSGRFTDVTAEAGVGDPAWSVSAIFFDHDRDGDLDLFVVNYVDYAVERNVDCYIGGQLAYCSPHAYDPYPNVLYRNDGGGRFTDVSAESGIGAHAGKGLGVSIADYDADGWIDVYVANDGVANFLFRNLGGGRFEEVALLAGAAYNESGVAEAGMGTDFTDLNGDGHPEVLVTNLDNELNNVYVNTGDGYFEERARELGMGMVSNPYVGFGCRAFDYDLDGDEDVYVANGHITDNIAQANPSASYEQDDFLFLNDGKGRFEEVLVKAGEVPRRVGRGLAVGDIDDDGDIDLVVTNNGQAPLVLRNDQKSGNGWVGILLEAKGANRDALGATLRFRVGGVAREILVRQRGSFVSAHDRRLLVGLGRKDLLEGLSIVWPDGTREEFGDLASGRYHRLRQGEAPR